MREEHRRGVPEAGPLGLLLDTASAAELDALVEMGVCEWWTVVDFAVRRLGAGSDTPALRELAGESPDPRRCHRAGLETLWTKVVIELGDVRSPRWDHVSVVHARHVLRLYRVGRLDEHAATGLLHDMSDPWLPGGPLYDDLRNMVHRHHLLVWAEEDAHNDPGTALTEQARARADLDTLAERLDHHETIRGDPTNPAVHR